MPVTGSSFAYVKVQDVLLFPNWYNEAFLTNNLLPNSTLTDLMRLEKGEYEMRNGKKLTAALFGYCEKGERNRGVFEFYSSITHILLFLRKSASA